MKKIARLILACCTLFLAGCSIIATDSESSSETIIYEKDEEGFYILEDDYFKDEIKTDNLKISKLRYNDNIPEDERYSQLRLYAGSHEIPLFNCKTNFSHTWNGDAPERMDNSVAVIEMEGKINFKLQANFAYLNECTIRPLDSKIIPSIDNNRRVISFTIDSPGKYTIELRSNRALHLFVNEYGKYDSYKNESNVIYFGPGIHTKDNSNYIDSNSHISIGSNTTIFVDYNAIVRASFGAYRQNNIKIVGSGIIDGSVFPRSATTGETKVPYDFNYCTNLDFEGITTTDPAGWVYSIYFCNNVNFDNVNIISSRSNGDGISIQSSSNVTGNDCFVRSWDDSIVIKNYPEWSNRSSLGTTRNINFTNCIIWTDLAQSLEIGFETLGQVMEDITFDNITILHNFHKAPISIHNSNNADLKNVTFSNITIEDANMGKGDGNNILIDFSSEYSYTWSTKQGVTSLGSVDGVNVSNVLVIYSKNPLVSIKGGIDPRPSYSKEPHMISNVSFEDVSISGVILDENYNKLEMAYCENVKFTKTGKQIKGATINKIDSSEYSTYFEIYE